MTDNNSHISGVLTDAELAAFLRISRHRLGKLVEDGKLVASLTVGKRRRWLPDDAIQQLRTHR